MIELGGSEIPPHSTQDFGGEANRRRSHNSSEPE